MSKSIILKIFEDQEVIFDYIGNELYLNATQTAKFFNKLPKDWLKTKETQAYLI